MTAMLPPFPGFCLPKRSSHPFHMASPWGVTIPGIAMLAVTIAMLAVLHAQVSSGSSNADSEGLAAAKQALNIAYTSVYFPDAFSTKPPSHVPVISVSSGVVTLSVGASVHGMSDAHHITAVWVRDQTGIVIFYKAFAADGSGTPVVTFTVPAGSTALTPYEHCNLHGTWRGATYYPAWEASVASLTAANSRPGPYNAT
jgi:desulfoferrodoxin (superoxide reductase-like protein)